MVFADFTKHKAVYCVIIKIYTNNNMHQAYKISLNVVSDLIKLTCYKFYVDIKFM